MPAVACTRSRAIAHPDAPAVLVGSPVRPRGVRPRTAITVEPSHIHLPRPSRTAPRAAETTLLVETGR